MIGTNVGRIRITGLLGQGGMGEVYLAFDERLQRRVALKAIRNERRLSPDSRERLLREARALSALDHPNICRIYDYAEGPSCDFLVLELVDGVTLLRAIEEGIGQARKLAVAHGILSALAAAHRRGIVHRDLKPDNIMITAGETVKILDFGIARSEARVSQAAQAAHEDMSELDDTVILDAQRASATVVAGTPLYMSPEQARGAAITTASDLFSFGLVLQTLLTGQPARHALGRDELLQLAVKGERLPMVGQPRALHSLVERLTSFAPADRPTAVESLRTIEEIQSQPARRVRAITAAVVAGSLLAGGVKYTVDVTAARRDAERRRAQAEDLVAFMVDDLPRKLEPMGKLDVIDSTATKALQYFASVSAEEMTGGELERHARALTQLGDVRVKQGKLPEASAMFRQSLRFAEAAVRRDPASDDYQLALSNSHFYAGDALRRQGDAQSALGHFLAYSEISARLHARHPHDPKLETELSYSHSNLGSIREALGHYAAAEREYRAAIAIDRRRVAQVREDSVARASLANSLNKLGVVLQDSGRLRAARAAFEEDVAIRKALAAERPGDAGLQVRLAASLAFLGEAQWNMGEVDAAAASTRAVLDLASGLAARDPQNLDWQRRLAAAQLRSAEIVARTDRSHAATLIHRAIATLDVLTARDARPLWQLDLASAHYQLAKLQLRGEDSSAAAPQLRRVFSTADELRRKRVSGVAPLATVLESLAGLAEIDRAQGRLELAGRSAETILELAGDAPQQGNPKLMASVARALDVLGRSEEASGIVAQLRSLGYRRPDFVARWSVAGAGPP